MTSVRIYGYSDDQVIVDGDLGTHQFDVFGPHVSPLIQYQGTLSLDRPIGEPLHVHILYSGCWSFAVDPGEVTCQMPGAKPFRVSHVWGVCELYSDTLTIDCPDGTTMRFLPAKRGAE